MADRGRDLKISILADVATIGAAAAADDLDRVGQSVEDAGAGMDRLDDDARSAGQGMDRLGSDAKSAASQVDRAATDVKGAASRIDTALDGIAANSKLSRNVDTDTGRATRSLKGFGQEAGQTAREVGASFDGSTQSIVGGFQEVAAQGSAAFGVLGAGAGLLAAGALGLIQRQIEATRARVTSLTTTMVDAGGKITGDSILSAIRDAAKAGDLVTWASQARAAGVDVRDFVRGMAGDADALARSTKALDANARSRAAFAGATIGGADVQTDFGRAVDKASSTAREQADIVRIAGEAMGDLNAVTGTSTAGLSAYQDAVEAVASAEGDLVDATTIAAQRIADATQSKTDSAQTYADTAVASIDDVIAAQQREITAALDFQTNSEAVFAAVGQAGVDWATSQGENAARAMALLAAAPAAKQAQVVANFNRSGALAGSSYASGIAGAHPNVSAAAARLWASAEAELGRKITIPVSVQTSGVLTDLGRVMASIAATKRAYSGLYRP